MRTIVQLSDLHFGTTLPETLDPLLELLAQIKPDLVIVSGDFTQRAHRRQFIAAHAYVQQLPTPRLLVPGNHDVPLYDIIRRFVSPLGRYRTHITSELAPSFVDAEIAVIGINTARSLTFKGGAIDATQIDEATTQLARLPSSVARIVVTHHPFDIPVGLTGVDVVGGAERAISAFAPHKVDLFLSGHLHLIHRASTSKYVAGYDAPMLVAGTAISTRARGEPNSFFVFRVEQESIACETRTWSAGARDFLASESQRFRRISGRDAGEPQPPSVGL